MSFTALIDYGSGNLCSVQNALAQVAGEVPVKLVKTGAELHGATHIILPGVGSFADCLTGLKTESTLLPALTHAVHTHKTPFLGICVGMQLLAETGEEDGVHQGLGWFKGKVQHLKPIDTHLKIPHMGWNTLTIHHPHPLLAGINSGDYAYFVHSYGFKHTNPNEILASTDYGGMIPSLMARDNLAGVQFHPEKSQALGLHLLKNFMEWQP